MEINTLVGITNPGGDAPHVSVSFGGYGAFDQTFYSWNNYEGVFPSSATFTANNDFCYLDSGWWYGVPAYIYIYIHILR
jgi:hypothetical protein